MTAKHVQFLVNGQDCLAPSDSQRTLADFLRNSLQLKATRVGCSLEQCGACKVLVDGVPKPSCQLEIGHLEGRSIRTAESLFEPTVDPLILAVQKFQAAQCAFCTSGLLIAAKALLTEVAVPTREQIVLALEGNLCRCGIHVRFVMAVESVVSSNAAKFNG